MTKDELHNKKQELMKPDWTENLHHELENMEHNDAKWIVESMTNSEIYSKVNVRRHQEDYIADYIEYLWDISPDAYWKHIIAIFDPNFDTLWGDSCLHFQRMCNSIIPREVFEIVLKYAIFYQGKENLNFDAVGCIIRAQIDKFGRIDEIKTYVNSLNKDIKEFGKKRIFDLAKKECGYQFGRM